MSLAIVDGSYYQEITKMAAMCLPLKIGLGYKNWPSVNFGQFSIWICCGPCWIVTITRNKKIADITTMKFQLLSWNNWLPNLLISKSYVHTCIFIADEVVEFSEKYDWKLIQSRSKSPTYKLLCSIMVRTKTLCSEDYEFKSQ